eukprot:8031161-Pyramimonas_sp.AAC.1
MARSQKRLSSPCGWGEEEGMRMGLEGEEGEGERGEVRRGRRRRRRRGRSKRRRALGPPPQKRWGADEKRNFGPLGRARGELARPPR